MLVRKIVGTWFLMDRSGELMESFDTKEEADLALFDATRRWESLYDAEAAENPQISGRRHLAD
ncbi:hypothetical protein [Faecalibaculum rodentium]|uniref:hypothetical protein n=1 Tax=Faecalibaculum rodentium TaxID=1702221 RepID=UPI0025B75A24|nr:hypothetical protein [Faecalibaculum rodentium]